MFYNKCLIFAVVGIRGGVWLSILSPWQLFQEFINKEQFIESGIFEELTSTEAGTQTAAAAEWAGAIATSTPSSLSKISEYGSCEELEMINGPGRWVPTLFQILFSLLHNDTHCHCVRYDHREELKTLASKLREMEAKWETLYTQHQEVSTCLNIAAGHVSLLTRVMATAGT